MRYKDLTNIKNPLLLLSMIVFCLTACSKDEPANSSALEEYENVYAECSKKLKDIKNKYKNTKFTSTEKKQPVSQINYLDNDDDDFFEIVTLDAWGVDQQEQDAKGDTAIHDVEEGGEKYDTIVAKQDVSENIDSNDAKTLDTKDEQTTEDKAIDAASEEINNHDSENTTQDTLPNGKQNEQGVVHKEPTSDTQSVSVGATQNNGMAFDMHGISVSMISDKDIVFGDRNADVVVIEYSSYSCPHCGYFHEKFFHKIDYDFIKTNKIAYVVREFISNRQDMDSAALARCGYKIYGTELYRTLRNILFEKQDNWAFNRNFSEVLTNIGQIAGINPDEYAKCVNDEDLQNFLLQHSKEVFKTPGFHGTPFFIINGEPLGKGFNVLYDTIQGLLKGKKAK